jgi:SAM-dependent methyltransferase
MSSVADPPGRPPPEFMETLLTQREAWERRPLVRELYGDWYARMAQDLSAVSGPTIEIGCGIGSLKEHLPGVIATDVFDTQWTDRVVDARRLPFSDASVANLVMVDVLHHLPEPVGFLEEGRRVLVPGGRVVMLEPFCSPISTRLWRRFHHEPVEFDVDPFSRMAQSQENPWDANSALPTLIFWRDLDRFEARFPEFEVIVRERLAWLLYPLSGGFSGPRLAPYRLRRVLGRIEALVPLAPLAALRCLVTLERRS